ncbi:MAG: PH domain-containing protein [Patescibacteria group bacterium]
MNNKLKPNKTSYFYFNFAVRVFSYFILTALMYAFGRFALTGFTYGSGGQLLLPFFFLGLFFLISAFSYINQKIRYRKKEYIFKEGRMIEKGGSIFSDYETELVIKNITHVDLKLPFIKYNLFETGFIKIESAGGGGTEIYLRDLDNSSEVYDYIKELMIDNGFDLSTDDLIQTEKPKTIPVVMETISRSLFFIFLILWPIVQAGLLTSVNPVIVNVTALTYLGLFFLVYFNLKRRTYNVYSEVITYSKEFLTKEYSLIPIENLADSSVRQSFLNKLLGYYDATISCQGAGQEIKFKNIANGGLLEENIDKLIAKTESLIGKSKSKEKSEKKEELTEQNKNKPEAKNNFTGKYKMNMVRTLFSTIFLIPFLPIWLLIVLFSAIKAQFTTYKIKEKSISERYNFLTQKSVEFTNDKITGVIFKESIIDKLFNTYSILFWSIGSTNNIEFKNIKKDSKLSEAIFEKLGIDDSKKVYQSDSTFSFLEALKANVYLMTTLILIGLGLLIIDTTFLLYYLAIVLVVGSALFGYKKIYYNRSKLKLYDYHAHFRRGIIFEEYYYVLYEDVKDIETTKYPLSGLGSIKFNVAGEEIKQQGKQTVTVSHHFKINYIPSIETKDDLIDLIFYKRLNKSQAEDVEKTPEKYKPETKMTAYPDLGNSVTKGIIFPIIIPIIIWWVKRKSYLIQDYRVVYRRGILFRKQTSIVFNKIDHIDHKQNILNKIFKNGEVLVNTVGSSKTELILKDISNFKEFYNLLESEYRNN